MAKKHLHLIILRSDSLRGLEQKVNQWFHDNQDLKVKQYGYIQNPDYSFYIVYEDE